MQYKLYTLVDITHTGHYRREVDNEILWKKEQNFNTILHTLGLRSNIFYENKPQRLEVGGRTVGFDTDEIIRVWRFDWTTEQDIYREGDDSVTFLKQDFHLVPYHANLDEIMDQTHKVFNVLDPGKNIVFFLKQ